MAADENIATLEIELVYEARDLLQPRACLQIRRFDYFSPKADDSGRDLQRLFHPKHRARENPSDAFEVAAPSLHDFFDRLDAFGAQNSPIVGVGFAGHTVT